MYSIKLAGKQIPCQITKHQFKQNFLSSDIKVGKKPKNPDQQQVVHEEKFPFFCKGLKLQFSRWGCQSTSQQ